MSRRQFGWWRNNFWQSKPRQYWRRRSIDEDCFSFGLRKRIHRPRKWQGRHDRRRNHQWRWRWPGCRHRCGIWGWLRFHVTWWLPRCGLRRDRCSKIIYPTNMWITHVHVYKHNVWCKTIHAYTCNVFVFWSSHCYLFSRWSDKCVRPFYKMNRSMWF